MATAAVSGAPAASVRTVKRGPSHDEVEGLVALDLGAAGGQLHILNVGSGWKSIFLYFQHYVLI